MSKRLENINTISNNNESCINKVFYKSSQSMEEIPDNFVDLIITSPPYFNIKDYSKDGYQKTKLSEKVDGQIGDIDNYEKYLDELLKVWKECERVLRPNGKLCINVPLMPMKKNVFKTHYTRHIFDLNSDIQQTILKHTKLYLFDTYIWNRKNPTKRLMFGSYPYPPNLYNQNTIEFITIYVKDGKPKKVSNEIKERSKLTMQEWLMFTKQIWDIPIPNKSDIAYGKHSAIMPEEIPYRLIKMFSFIGDVVLDPFAGSGTTLKVAKQLGRKYIGYEIMKSYKEIIEKKLQNINIK